MKMRMMSLKGYDIPHYNLKDFEKKNIKLYTGFITFREFDRNHDSLALNV